uniref:Ig-like domain-containing protein n=1 Tax=Sparus aurata TaxID=8175 RepID=A0A671Y4C4_SPAAU
KVCHLCNLCPCGCTDDLNFEMKTVKVGNNVTLTCARQESLLSTFNLFWIRLVSGNMPELLGGTYSFDFDGGKKTRITAKQGDGTFLLHISKAQLSDTGIYYCLKVKRPKPDITTIIQLPPSGPVLPGDSVTLQCSVLSDSQNKTCPGDHSVFWFRAGSKESDPTFIYSHIKSGAECETSLEARSPQKCVYSFSKNFSSSDAGTYYCAVATCGEILFGNGTKLDIEDSYHFLLVILSQHCGICRRPIQLCFCSVLDEDLLTHSAPTFTKRKPRKADRKQVKPAEAKTTYSDIRTFVID